MPGRYATTPLQALYRVFVHPAKGYSTLSSRTPLLNASHRVRAVSPAGLSIIPRSRHQQRRGIAKTKKDDLASKFPDWILNEAVRSLYINIVNEDNQFIRGVSTRDVLRDINRSTHALVKVSDAQDPADPRSYPTCKVYSLDWLRQQQRLKAQQQRDQVRSSGRPKILELNWALDQQDLEHKIRAMKEFLREGRKVDIMLAPKRKGKRKATEDECEEVLKQLRDAALGMDGVREHKEPVGKVGEMMTLSFKGSEDGSARGDVEQVAAKEKKKGKAPKPKALRPETLEILKSTQEEDARRKAEAEAEQRAEIQREAYARQQAQPRRTRPPARERFSQPLTREELSRRQRQGQDIWASLR